MMNTTQTLTINGITYQVIERQTTEELGVKFPRLAVNMRQDGKLAQIALKRPNGRVVKLAFEYAGNRYGFAVSAR